MSPHPRWPILSWVSRTLGLSWVNLVAYSWGGLVSPLEDAYGRSPMPFSVVGLTTQGSAGVSLGLPGWDCVCERLTGFLCPKGESIRKYVIKLRVT